MSYISTEMQLTWLLIHCLELNIVLNVIKLTKGSNIIGPSPCERPNADSITVTI